MKKALTFKQGNFLSSQISHKILPRVNSLHGSPLDEIAIVGRSNVGKSSLLNHLMQTKSLAKVSAKPGKTQTLNFFRIDDLLCLVDLPGYGYAKTSRSEQKIWSQGTDDYLNEREQLKLLLLLIDFRHPPMDSDLKMIDWAMRNERKFLIIFTKVDKIPKTQRKLQLEKNLASLKENAGIIPKHPVLYSIKEPTSRVALIENINQALWGF